jgi:hypothetical protein
VEKGRDSKEAGKASAMAAIPLLLLLFLSLLRTFKMTTKKSIYTKIEFTLCDDAADNFRYREAVSKLLEEFEDFLIGFQAEDLITNEFYCDDAGKEEAQVVLKTIFPRPISAESGNVTQY